MYQSSIYMFARRLVRKTKMLPWMVKVWRKLFRLSYESSFNNFIINNIRSHDVFWDVGANNGHYIEEIKPYISNLGKIIGFEPSPTSLKILNCRFKDDRNIVIVNKALSDSTGDLQFYYEPNAISSVEDSLQFHPEKESCTVMQVTAESFVAENMTNFPNCIKIDVEGFEDKVIAGLGSLLNDSRLRCLFIEMHFSKLDALNKRDSVNFIFKTLKKKGFSLKWTDPSHLCAVRK